MTVIDTIEWRVTMNDRINKTSICSIVFLDIIEYSKTPVYEQYEVKNQFNDFIGHALKDVAQNDRIIIDTGDGAAIAYMGSPEDALFMALSIRDGILKNNAVNLKTMSVRIGINLGPVRVVKDINGHPNIIGDGINVAQRIMSFAKPNQILVSRSYFEVTSRLTQEMSSMFDYSGMKQDKHVREHEVYSVKMDNDQFSDEASATPDAEPLAALSPLPTASQFNWKYAASGLAVVAVLFGLVKALSMPTEPAINITQPAVAASPGALTPSLKLEKTTATANEAKTSEQKGVEVSQNKSAATENSAKEQKDKAAREKIAQDKLAKATLAKARLDKKNVKKKSKSNLTEDSKSEPSEELAPAHTEISQNQTMQNKQETSNHTQTKASTTNAIPEQSESKCTQAQIAMGQCR